MKMYITSRFKDAAENKEDIEQLCSAVRSAGFEDFNFIRDVEKFNPNHFDTQQEVWDAALNTLRGCDTLLIDISDAPSGGRIVEVGMAYALQMPIYVICKSGARYKEFYKGIATHIIEYEKLDDVTEVLKLNPVPR